MIHFTNLSRSLEIGSNCYLLDMEGSRVILDSGMHPKKEGSEACPEHALIGAADPDAIFITHAHLDHIGTLPLLQALVVLRQSAGMTPESLKKQVNQSLKWMGDTLAKVAAPGSSVGMEHLSGPVGIGHYLYRMLQAPEGWKLILWFAVVLNVNLAVLNILPLPVVDGGHVVLGTAELLLRRPVEGKVLDWVQNAFVALLLAFFAFVTLKDVGDLVPSGAEPAELPEPLFSES